VRKSDLLTELTSIITIIIIIIIIILIITDRTIPNNKPDIIISGNEKGTCMLIEAANSGGRNVI
jgi:hypothetical protein